MNKENLYNKLQLVAKDLKNNCNDFLKVIVLTDTTINLATIRNTSISFDLNKSEYIIDVDDSKANAIPETVDDDVLEKMVMEFCYNGIWDKLDLFQFMLHSSLFKDKNENEMLELVKATDNTKEINKEVAIINLVIKLQNKLSNRNNPVVNKIKTCLNEMDDFEILFWAKYVLEYISNEMQEVDLVQLKNTLGQIRAIKF